MNLSSIWRRLFFGLAAAGILGGVGFSSSAALPTKVQGHSSALAARITLRDGTSQPVTLQGVGCPVSMCSRVAVKSRIPGDRLTAIGLHKELNTWLDSIASIKEITPDDALFVFKDGTARRLAVVNANRILYVASYFGSERINLADVRTLEFVSRN